MRLFLFLVLALVLQVNDGLDSLALLDTWRTGEGEKRRKRNVSDSAALLSVLVRLAFECRGQWCRLIMRLEEGWEGGDDDDERAGLEKGSKEPQSLRYRRTHIACRRRSSSSHCPRTSWWCWCWSSWDGPLMCIFKCSGQDVAKCSDDWRVCSINPAALLALLRRRELVVA